MPKCKNCPRQTYPGYASCCRNCSDSNGRRHNGDCLSKQRKNKGGISVCKNCPRLAYGRYTTCCVNCMNSNGRRHNGDCLSKQNNHKKPEISFCRNCDRHPGFNEEMKFCTWCELCLSTREAVGCCTCNSRKNESSCILM